MKRFFSFQRSKKPDPIDIPPRAASPVLKTVSPKVPKAPIKKKPNGLWREIQLLAGESGLLLRPVTSQDDPKPSSHVKIPWGQDVKPASQKGAGESGNDWSKAFTVYGILGVLSLFNTSYLLVITARDSLGELLDPSRPVYGIKAVISIPLEYNRASSILDALVLKLAPKSPMPPPNQPPIEAAAEKTGSLHVKWAPQQPPSAYNDSLSVISVESSGASTPTSTTSLTPITKVLVERLAFWKARRPSAVGEALFPDPFKEEDLIESLESGEIEPGEVLDTVAAAAPGPATAEEKHTELEEKIVKETIRQFTKGGLYFSYEFDLSNTLQRKQQQITRLKRQSALLRDLDALGDYSKIVDDDEKTDAFAEPLPDAPLWEKIERRFWWNEHLLRPFVEAKLHSYILPVMQGWFQVSSFHVPGLADPVTPRQEGDANQNGESNDSVQELTLNQSMQSSVKVDYIIISRRSRDRAGLRYQRRGIDDDSNVANFAETESIVRVVREKKDNVFSYVQIRGSIPLYWAQASYGFKPPPTLDVTRTSTQNLLALRTHFEKTVRRYGPVTVVNLAEQHGKEGSLTDGFREKMHELHSPDARYHEFDFHAECKGMRYENISKLIQQLERTFEQQGFFWVSGGLLMSQQKGAFRVNCIDCLDRTNVVQSAFAREVLSSQLEALALLNPSDGGRSEAEVVFNDVWANNGDAISRAYAGTSALKGDFTRTGKRDLGGMLNDGINSLARVYTATFSDWFSQAVIDYMLGNRGTEVFAEFLLKLASNDPRDMLRLSKVRAAAIESAATIVLLDGEHLIKGWTLLSPVELNVRISDKFEEKILLLTNKALYIVSYDYSLEKVVMFTRVPLGDVQSIQKGAYILSTLSMGGRDPVSNYGFVIAYHDIHQDTRVSSYSVRNQPAIVDPMSPPQSPTLGDEARGSSGTLSKILSNATPEDKIVSIAFKSLPIDPTRWQTNSRSESAKVGLRTCKAVTEEIVDTIKTTCEPFGVVDGDFLKEADVVSLLEAQRSTTLFAKVEYNLKRLLWLGG